MPSDLKMLRRWWSYCPECKFGGPERDLETYAMQDAARHNAMYHAASTAAEEPTE